MTASPTRSRVALWWAGARPRTLGASVAPVLVGASAAAHPTFPRTLGALIVSLSLQVGVNYANDYFDGVRRVDTAERVGPVRLTASGLASPRAVATAAGLAFAVAAIVGTVVAIVAAPVLLAVGVAAVAAAVLYSGGPAPYAARGLGEVSVFVFFGLAATCGTAFVMDHRVPAGAWWGGVAIGLLAVAILVANNLRDIPTDAAAGKRTLAVRLGDARTRLLYRATVVLAFMAIALGIAVSGLPAWAALTFAGAPLAARLLIVVGRARGRELVPVLVGTAALEVVASVLLAAGLWIARA